MRLTFKKEPRETGLAAIANPYQDTTIKGDGKPVGIIRHSRENDWMVRFTIKDEHRQPCGWKWIQLKARTPSEPEMREKIKALWEQICSQYTLHQFED